RELSTSAQCFVQLAAASGQKRNRLRPRAATTIRRSFAKPAFAHTGGRPLFRRSHRTSAERSCFRRLLVGPAAAVSLAKPSNPADEENFAPLHTADSTRVVRHRERAGGATSSSCAATSRTRRADDCCR